MDQRLSPADAEPLKVLGPYHLGNVLGHGGMGVVYSAVHGITGEAVAVKTVSSLSYKALSALRAEVIALKRIRHPGIVPILAEGLSEGLPWYAMELLEGRTLKGFNEELWARSLGSARSASGTTLTRTGHFGESAAFDADFAASRSDAGSNWEVEPSARPAVAGGRLLEVLTLYRHICDALRHIHRRGLVHRDVKPSNIFLKRDAGPVLMDFGLVTRAQGGIGREALASEVSGGRMLGTAPYVSPEQIRGEVVDARADLYSLGCMLYESLVGAPPFDGPAVRHVLLGHLNDEPIPPSTLVAGVPPALDHLVLSLLAKTPYDRLGHAEDVDTALADLGAEASSTSSSESDSPPYLYRPRLAGRHDVLDLLDRACEQAVSGQGSLWLVGGESGIGKTSLLTEVTQRALARRFAVVTGECVPIGHAGDSASERGGAPFQPFRRLLQYVADRCREGGPEVSVRLLGSEASLLAQYEPSLASLPSQDGLALPSQLGPGAARQRMLLNTLARTLSAIADEQPLLWVIDDLQWADELSLGFLSSLTREFLADKKLLVIGTYRSDEVSAPLQPLLQSQAVAHAKLGRLDAVAITSIVRDMLAIATPPESLVQFLTQHSEGNPFFVAEYLRVAVGENLVRRRAGGWDVPLNLSGGLEKTFDSIPLSSSIKELIGRHLRDLDPRSRTLVQAASVLGREFETELLSPFWAADENRFESLALLQRRQILEPSGLGRLRFVHDKLREFTYASISDEQRRLLHQKAAEALELRWTWSAEQPTQYPALADHWSQAGYLRKGADYFLRAAARSRASFANGDAIRFYEHAIDNLRRHADGSKNDLQMSHDLLLAFEGLADILAITGANERSCEHYRLALEQPSSHAPLVEARLTRKIGKTHTARNQHALALELYTQAEDILNVGLTSDHGAEQSSSWREWVELQNERVWAHYWMGNSLELDRLVARLGPIVERHGTASQTAQHYQALCLSELRRERYRVSPESLALIRAAADAAERSEISLESASVRFILAFALLLSGKNDEAIPELERVIEAADRYGDVLLRIRGLTYMGVARRQQGDVEGTRALAQMTINLATTHATAHYLGAGYANLGWAMYSLSLFEEAEAPLSAALRAWQAAPTTYPFQGLALWPLCATLLRLGRQREAREHLAYLLDPSQRRLPDDVGDRLRWLISGAPDDLTFESTAEFFELARHHHLL